MVTKQTVESIHDDDCSVLAKIHMVTKLGAFLGMATEGSVLAKIHMVTKQT